MAVDGDDRVEDCREAIVCSLALALPVPVPVLVVAARRGGRDEEAVLDLERDLVPDERVLRPPSRAKEVERLDDRAVRRILEGDADEGDLW